MGEPLHAEPSGIHGVLLGCRDRGEQPIVTREVAVPVKIGCTREVPQSADLVRVAMERRSAAGSRSYTPEVERRSRSSSIRCNAQHGVCATTPHHRTAELGYGIG